MTLTHLLLLRAPRLPVRALLLKRRSQVRTRAPVRSFVDRVLVWFATRCARHAHGNGVGHVRVLRADCNNGQAGPQVLWDLLSHRVRELRYVFLTCSVVDVAVLLLLLVLVVVLLSNLKLFVAKSKHRTHCYVTHVYTYVYTHTLVVLVLELVLLIRNCRQV
jgi:hypothetical protein